MLARLELLLLKLLLLLLLLVVVVTDNEPARVQLHEGREEIEAQIKK